MIKDILSYKDFSLFSNRKKSKWKNDGIRSIYESIIPKDVIVALDDWKSSNTSNCVLIGGIALSYYIKPRYTEDINLIFLTDEDIPLSVYKFRRNRKHSYEHIKTGVEVELITPEYINKDNSLFKNVFETSIESDGINFGITSNTLSETATEAYKQATNFGEGILSILGIQSSTTKLNSTHIDSNRSTTSSKLQVSGFLTGVSKSVMSSMTPIGLSQSTQSSISQSSVTRHTLRRRTGIEGDDLLVDKKEQSIPSVKPFDSSISHLETKTTTTTTTTTTTPNVLLSSSGRRIYLGRSAERVARIKAQKAERTARKITTVEGAI